MSSDDRLRVMLVDDYELLRAGVRRALSAPDISIVAEAGSGEEAIPLALEVRPDVLLLDVNMPGMSGIDVVRDLAGRLPETHIIMLTASATKLQVLEAVAAGAEGVLTKDLDSDALLRTVRGIRRGDLAMSRALAASMLRYFQNIARRAGVFGAGAPGQINLIGLSERELQVLRHLSDGRTDRQIAELLVISHRTVEKHVGTILRKLAVENRFEAAMVYRRGDLELTTTTGRYT